LEIDVGPLAFSFPLIFELAGEKLALPRLLFSEPGWIENLQIVRCNKRLIAASQRVTSELQVGPQLASVG
jgi:hypothetical protein